MAKVCRPSAAPQVPSVTPYMSSKRETYTIWMKSLVCNTNGCTVYNSNGEIVYRVDNYDKRCSNEVHLMNLQGKLLYTIRKKKLQAFERWDGYKWSGSCKFEKEEKPWFHVKRYSRMLMGSLACQITVGFEKYWIVRLTGKTTAGFRIVDIDGGIAAEAKKKLSSSGIVLGEDVLTLEVETHMDHSLVMAIVTAYGLICRKM
ncbi:putative tubby-like domain-containing protein [Rosa chinensis]|uniref:Putative tubby-like domain-containing protein n=1 Tax=Rosa chinensis TaxID=74649 RepID=A0A2P6P759_ROSCH|nr:protein LURP-one-related 4 [Rosa chinensis]PRQ17742.1 putative tubby-like domain-containing protein [Rosa chinensis]